MINELNTPVTANVFLFDEKGVEIASQTVVFGSHTQQVLEVSQLLVKSGRPNQTGSVEIIPDSAGVRSVAIAAQLSVTGTGAGSDQHFEEEFIANDPNGSSIFRATAAELVGKPIVALRNNGTTGRKVVMTCVGAELGIKENYVSLNPRELALVRACSDLGNLTLGTIGDGFHQNDFTNNSAFGLSVSSDGKASDVSVFAFHYSGDKQNPTLSSMNFTDVSSVVSSSTMFVGVPVGQTTALPGVFRPVIALTNFGSKAATVSVRFAATEKEHSVTSQVVFSGEIPKMSTRLITVSPSSSDSGMRNSFVVTTDSAPGEFYSAIASISDGVRRVESIGKNEKITNNGGGHPWSIANGQSAVLLLFNHSPSTTVFNVKLGNGAILWHKSWTLAPMETAAISINDLILSKTRDEVGAILPPALVSGEVSWFTANPGYGKGRMLQIDSQRRLARNFSCGYNIVLCGVVLDTGSISFPFQSDSSPSALGALSPQMCLAYDPNACSGQSYGSGGGGYSYSWASNTPSIATVSGSSTSSTATFWGAGVGSGSAVGYISSATCSPSGTGITNVVQIDHLQVTGDIMGNISGCPTTVYRSVRYQVVNSNNAPVNISLSVQEAYTNVPPPLNNTCNSGAPSPTGCNLTDSSGSFYDTLQVGCNSVGGSCGFTLAHQWLSCGSGKVLANLTDSVHNDQVIINGYASSIPIGTQFR